MLSAPRLKISYMNVKRLNLGDLLLEVIAAWRYEAFFKGPDINERAVRQGVKWLYPDYPGLKTDVNIYGSPFACQRIIRNYERTGGSYTILYSIVPNVWNAIRSQMEVLEASPIWKDTISHVRSILMPLTKYLWSTIVMHTSQAIEAEGVAYIRFAKDNLCWRYIHVIIYDFFIKAGLVENPLFEKYVLFLKAGCFLNLFYDRAALIVRRPKTLKLHSSMLFHCDGGPAIEWEDGWKKYYLNGVEVSPEIAITPAERLDATLVVREKNAEVRREIVRKIGPELVVRRLGGSVIDSWNGYELLQLKIPGMTIVPTYLKMKNPSIGTYHIEGVPPRIKTCLEALSWRVDGVKWSPEQLT